MTNSPMTASLPQHPPILRLRALTFFVLPLLLLPLVLADPSDKSYQLVWSDEFTLPDYSPPDSSLWSHEVGPGPLIGGNDELEYYTAALNNSFILDHTLVVQSLYQPNYSQSGLNFTSARLNSLNKVELYLGYVEARIRVLTMADGHWPAFWMLGHCSQPYPNCGEIDIMEQVNGPVGNDHGNDKQQCGTLWSNPNGINGSAPTGPYHHSGGCIEVPANVTQWGDDWHVYAMKWNLTAIDFLVDGLLYSSSVFGSDVGFDCYQSSSDPYYLIVNLAEGGTNPGVAPVKDAFPTQLQVDWVRVWQQADGQSYINAPNATAALPADGTSSTGGSAVGARDSSSSSAGSRVGTTSSSSSSGGQTEVNGASNVSFTGSAALLSVMLCLALCMLYIM